MTSYCNLRKKEKENQRNMLLANIFSTIAYFFLNKLNSKNVYFIYDVAGQERDSFIFIFVL